MIPKGSCSQGPQKEVFKFETSHPISLQYRDPQRTQRLSRSENSKLKSKQHVQSVRPTTRILKDQEQGWNNSKMFRRATGKPSGCERLWLLPPPSLPPSLPLSLLLSTPQYCTRISALSKHQFGWHHKGRSFHSTSAVTSFTIHERPLLEEILLGQ